MVFGRVASRRYHCAILHRDSLVDGGLSSLLFFCSCSSSSSLLAWSVCFDVVDGRDRRAQLVSCLLSSACRQVHGPFGMEERVDRWHVSSKHGKPYVLWSRLASHHISLRLHTECRVSDRRMSWMTVRPVPCPPSRTSPSGLAPRWDPRRGSVASPARLPLVNSVCVLSCACSHPECQYSVVLLSVCWLPVSSVKAISTRGRSEHVEEGRQ